jgi:hypothetical protein
MTQGPTTNNPRIASAQDNNNALRRILYELAGNESVLTTLAQILQNQQTGTQNVSVDSLPLPHGAATEATLAALKDVDGIKKIVDALPAGTNRIGKVYLTDGTNDVPVIVLPFTSEKALRVIGGPTDPISDIPVTILFEHHQVHEGEAYEYVYPLTALGSGNNLDFRLVVPTYANVLHGPHFYFEMDCLSQTSYYLYEGATFSAPGTAQNVYNRNRNSANIPGMGVYLAPTTSTTGTKLTEGVIGDGTVGGNGNAQEEFVLKSNTLYLLRLTANAASDSVCVRMKWYEDLGV